MIQINLLPDVKREYLHAQQVKHTFTMGSIVITIAAVGLLGALFAYVQFVQPRHRSNLQVDIDSGINELKNTEDAVKIVTVQSVLEQIPGLQDKKLITSNLFNYLVEFTPREVSYSQVQLDLTTNTLTLNGQTTAIEQANILANNLKSAQFSYVQNEDKQTVKPFSNIVFASLGKVDQAESNLNVSFEISFQVDQTLFKQDIKDGKITVNAASEELLLPTTSPFSGNAAGTPGATQ